MKHHSQTVDFSNLDFKVIDTEVLADEAKEQEETIVVANGADGATDARPTKQDHEDQIIVAP